MRERVNRRGFLKLYKIFLIIFLVLLFVLTFFIARSNLFIIKALDIQTEKINCTSPNQIRDESQLLGQNLILLNSAKVEGDLKKKFICIKLLKVSRYFPNKVKLQVFGREAAAVLIVSKSEEATSSAVLEKFEGVIATPSGEASDSSSLKATSASFSFFVEDPIESFLIDNEGVIYSNNIEQINVPKIYISEQNLTLDQKITGDLIVKILKVLEKIKTFNIDIKEAKIYSRNLLLINAVPRIIFKIDDRIDTQIASLQLILNQSKIDTDDLEFIDLRFDKPIVKFAPKKVKNG